MNKQILSKAISVVGVLLSAFGSIVIKVQPPGDGPQQTAGLVGSFSALAVLLIVSGVASVFKLNYFKYVWITLGILGLSLFIYTSFSYGKDKSKYVIGLPPDEPTHYHIVGDILSKEGFEIKERLEKDHKPTDNAHLVSYDEGPSNIKVIWTPDSVDRITDVLVKEYAFLMLFLAISIFSITEGIFYGKK